MQALKAAGLDWPDLDRVLLVGGSTRMPMVRDMLQQLSGKAPDASVAADEAVAHGAALHAGADPGQARGPAAGRSSIRNVNSHSLGVVGIDPQTRRRRNGILIPRNTPLPVTAKRTFKTAKADQRSILRADRRGREPVGRRLHAHRPLLGPPICRPDLPAKSPVDILFHYEADGRLEGPRARAQTPTANSRPKSSARTA